MTKAKNWFLLVTVAVASGALAAVSASPTQEKAKADPATCPLHEQHMKEKKAAPSQSHTLEEMNKRGEDERGMGFSQTGTVHHFFLAKDGGTIQVEVKNAKDSATLQAVRAHLQEIAASFARGDFSIPRFVHGSEPDGVRGMQRAKAKITYRFEEIPDGGRVVLRAADKKALAAVHSFLRFQITEHRTGDALTIPQ